MRDENGLRRQWTLLRLLASRTLGLTIRQMGHELRVTERTIRRDLNVFRSVGFPLQETVGDYGRKTWKITSGRDQPQLSFTYDEAIALYVGQQLLEPLAGTPFGDAARHAFQKIVAVLGQGALDYIERFSSVFHQTGIGLRDYASKSELIDALREAIEDSKEAQVRYRSEADSRATNRVLHPYGIVFHRGALYLVALATKDDKVKHYKVDRIEEVEVGKTVARPVDFNLSAHMASAFAAYRNDGELTNVKVRFEPAVARYVQESKWHASQLVTPQQDGAVVAEFRVSGTEEIKRWILGFGCRAVVLEPESLRLEIIRELNDLVNAYQSSVDPSTPSPERSGQPNPQLNRRRTRQTVNREI
jgi:predicted DNA-binding transcriptional regulator YafY